MLINPNESILLFHHYPRVLIDLMAEYGVSRDEILLGTQVESDVFDQEDATISYAQYGVLILNAMRLFPEQSLGLEFGKRCYITQHGMVGVAAMSSQTLQGALEVLETYYKMLSPIVTLSWQVVGDQCVVKAEKAWNIGPLQAMAMETFFSGLMENCDCLVGRKIPARFYFQHTEPEYVELYKASLGDQCHFECASDQVVFDKQWLEAPLIWRNELTRTQALKLCDDQLAKINGHESLLSKLRRLPLIREGRVLALDEAASQLHMSGRSLRRHLSILHTSYQQVADKVRAEMAEDLLRQNQLTVAEIAEEIGFSDVANFRKAFKRWLGKTPSEFRRSME